MEQNKTKQMDWDRLATVGWNPKSEAEYKQAIAWFTENVMMYTRVGMKPTGAALRSPASLVRFTEYGMMQEVLNDYTKIYRNWDDFKELVLSCCPTGHFHTKPRMNSMDF